MAKAAFFRNVKDYAELNCYSSYYYGVVAEYRVIATIVLEAETFSEFCNDFLVSREFLQPYIHKAITINGEWRCVMVRCKDQRILVVLNHYQYPRYLARL